MLTLPLCYPVPPLYLLLLLFEPFSCRHDVHLSKFGDSNVGADGDVTDEPDAFVSGDFGESVVDVFDVGMIGCDAVSDEAEGHRKPLEDVHRQVRSALLDQMLGDIKTGRTRTHDTDLGVAAEQPPCHQKRAPPQLDNFVKQ